MCQVMHSVYCYEGKRRGGGGRGRVGFSVVAEKLNKGGEGGESFQL